MAETAPRKYKILIVDDDADILATMKLALTNLGLEVLTANDGLLALDVAAANDPDMMVLDLMLPKRGGFQVLQRIKGNPSMKGKRPLVLMVTGNEGKRHKDFAELGGVDAYLNKPFAMAHLLEVIQGFIVRLDKGIPNAR
jgi:DNA-binding response OmpR family regulator